ncbi:MAG: hypothetical protein AAF990_16975 [Bacteroidota bacterium]
MKKVLTLLLLILVCHQYSHAQRGKKWKEKSIFTSSSLSYYPEIESYSFFRTIETSQDELILNFLTSNSGTFILEDNIRVLENENINRFPSQLINIGASFQIVNANSTFHELSLTRTSHTKSSYVNTYAFVNLDGDITATFIGYEQKSTLLAFRYEFGKYFGNAKTSRVRFGLSGSIEPTFYTYKRTALSLQSFPIKARIFAIEMALIPILSTKLSKRIWLDFKLIPNVLIADFGEVRVQNPVLTTRQSLAERDYNLPEVSLAGSIQFRYMLKEPQQKRRRRSRN